jgi:hypothetical protein
MTAPYHEQKLANRELGTVEKIDGDGNLKLRMDSGRVVEFNARQHPHLDYGYAVMSHSSQGQTADRVLIHIDSEQAHSQLLNSRMAYVSMSLAQYENPKRFQKVPPTVPKHPELPLTELHGTAPASPLSCCKHCIYNI